MKKKSGFIFGLNKITSAITTPDTDNLFRTPDAQAYKKAKLEDILKYVSIEEIKKFKDNKSKSYRARNFIPIPPFLMHPVHSAISVYQGNVERIFLDVIISIKLFDSLHESDDEYIEKAAVKCKPLLIWLYVAIWAEETEGVYKVQSEPCSNAELVNLLKKVESNCLNQACDLQTSMIQSLKLPLEQLAVASKSTQETISKWASFQVYLIKYHYIIKECC